MNTTMQTETIDPSQVQRPLLSTVVGWIYILLGCMAVWSVIAKLMSHSVSINFGVLLVPVGIGILGGRSSSVFWGRFWAGFFCALMVAMAFAYPVIGHIYKVRLSGEELHGWPRHLIGTLLPTLFALVMALCWRWLGSPAHQAFVSAKQRLPL